MNVSELCGAVEAKPGRNRVGRGIGSGNGKTCGRGHKGNGSRSGAKRRLMFEGGQTSIVRRVAKRGFTGESSIHSPFVVSLGRLAKLLPNGGEFGVAELKTLGCPRRKFDSVRVVSGEATALPKIIIRGAYVTRNAAAAIKAAGGSIQ